VRKRKAENGRVKYDHDMEVRGGAVEARSGRTGGEKLRIDRTR
jgi:hypothetical protein